MYKLFTSIIFFIVSIALFNQINAQVPNFISTIESSPTVGNLETDYFLVGLDYYSKLSKQSLNVSKLKAAQTELELLDSIVYLETFEGTIYNGDKKVWEYDDDGNKTYFSWYFWSTANEAWMGRQRLDSIFDANGQLSVIISDGWNRETRQWQPDNKIEWKYNSNGDLILYANYSWNNDAGEWEWNSKIESTHSYTEDNSHIIFSITYNYNNAIGVWTPHHRNEIHYDANGNMTLYNASLLDSETNTWVFKTGSFLYEYTYDSYGNQTLNSYYRWNSEIDQWEGQGNLIESGFDSNGNMVSRVFKIWDKSLNQWVNNTKSEFRNIGYGLISQHITYQWNSLIGDWMALHQTETSFNENGDETRIIGSEWDRENNLWVIISQQELIYDAFGNLSQFTELQIDTTSNEWYANTKEIYTYDAFNNEILKESFKLNDDGVLFVYRKKETAYNANGNVILKADYELDEIRGDFIKSSDSQYTYNELGDKLIEEATSIYYDGIPFVLRTNYYYSIHSVTSVNTSINIKTDVALVYPNPFTNQLSIKLNDNNNRVVLELFNSQGLKVLSKSVQSLETIDVASLKRGVYSYTLSFENKIHRGKLIKK